MKGVWFADWGLGPGVYTEDGTTVLKDIILPLGANWIAIQSECVVDIRKPSTINCGGTDGFFLAIYKLLAQYKQHTHLAFE